jgi:hypothetical protein
MKTTLNFIRTGLLCAVVLGLQWLAVPVVKAAVVISTPPQNTTVLLGDRVDFTVLASGAGSLTYQWKKTGVVIAGANSSVFTLNPVAFNNAGDYTVGLLRKNGQ